MLCSLSKLDQTKIDAIKSAEQNLGKTLLAFTCHDITPADLSQEELNILTATEKKLGIVLVAVKS